ncbi:hypothetical protein ScPMuIL_004427, partial [Solemya velum]
GQVKDVFRFVLFYSYFPALVFQLVLSCFVDKQSDFSELYQDPNPCPETNASFLSKITFWWFSGLVVTGHKRALERQDLWSLPPQNLCSWIVPIFSQHWQNEVNKIRRKRKLEKKDDHHIEMVCKQVEDHLVEDVQIMDGKKEPTPSLVMCLVKTFGTSTLVAGIFKLIFDLLVFISPFILKKLINFTENKSEYLWRGFMYAFIMYVVALIQSILLHQYFHGCFVLGMRLRTAIVTAVYQKMLKLSNTARKKSTVGEIVNLMSVDAQRFMDLTTYLHMTWSAPLQIALCLYFLWQTLGPSVLAGLGVMILLMPVNAFIASKYKVLQSKQMTLKDTRIKIMNEVLNGIKVLKLYAWEPSFEKKILGIRNEELLVLKRAAYLNACNSFTWSCAPVLVSLTTFAVYVLSDVKNVLDAEKAFVSLSLFNILRFPVAIFPQIISQLVQASVSLKRLKNFMNHEELDPTAVNYDAESKLSVSVVDGSFSWDNGKTRTLTDIQLQIAPGSLVAVVGVVGSGKSSLLSAILGEMDKLEGSISVKGTLAYVAQVAWIQNATLKDNILFGKYPLETEYKKIVEACALRPDFEILLNRDLTEIGEKGINLSGGQKQRVSLARALYQDSDIYLLDDPLSAVDSHVGKHIFENVIGPNGLLKNKTRILVTHGINFLPKMDTIVVLVDGKISEMGSYQQLLDHKGAFAQFLTDFLQHEMEIDDKDLDEIDGMKLSPIYVSRSLENLSSSTHNSLSYLSHSKHKSSKLSLTSTKQNTVKKKDTNKLIQEETVETGNVKLSVFVTYIQSIGVPLTVTIIIFYIIYNGVGVYSNIWLSEWSEDPPAVNGTVDTTQRDMRLGVYGALSIVQGFFTFFGAICLYLGHVHAGRLLHARILKNLFNSPLSFLNSTPSGRIMNRFNKDVDTVDNKLMRLTGGLLTCLMHVLAIPVVVGYSTPLFLIALTPLVAVYVLVQRYYVATSRQLRRLESVSRSPIYSHFGETVLGVASIRAFKQQERFIMESEAKIDENQVCYYPSIVANRWLALRLEFVGNCIVFFAALFAVLARDSLSSGLVGLSITYAMNVTQTLNWLVRMTCELESNIVAVERIKEYSETPIEAAWTLPGQVPPPDWPNEGRVQFVNYCTRYREELDFILRGITCTIEPKEKIGIVGRTGAGKSSLTLSLFRVIEAVQGSIIIDGINIADIGLHDLRSKLTIIPQEPVLFSGSLRVNLDPFSEYDDDSIWQSLERAHLKPFVSQLGDKLEHECAEGGENFSVGQRQLICMARALLRKTKIIVLDEATAAVDLKTDDLIQQTIRTEFENSTILTIAHRLNTIIDYTKVMVLDGGKIQEFESPQILLRNPQSLFFSLAKDAGLIF